VGADGRSSEARRGFEVRHDEPFLVLSGVLLKNMPIAPDTGLIHLNPAISHAAYLFPQREGRVRAYAAWPEAEGFRLNGEADFPAFVRESLKAGAPAAIFEGVEPVGPLATFDATDRWVEHPYSDSVVLVGDAAASHDPSWGQGLSLAFRDVRVLRDCLLASDDWDTACHAYAREHQRHYGVIHEVTHALKDMFLRSGPEADARRQRALPLIAQDPMRVPDHAFSGPDLPWGPDVLRKFFAEDGASQVA
jgi:2-polyprenyl-6-methoxyphenol hydroxylase-like FAD-dependent oxidoreductase